MKICCMFEASAVGNSPSLIASPTSAYAICTSVIDCFTSDAGMYSWLYKA